MFIQPRQALTGADLQAGLDHIGASVASLARDSGVPRYNLGLLRSKGVALSKAHDVALRQYLGEQGVEIAGEPDHVSDHAPAETAEKSVRFCWPLPDAVSDEDVQRVLGMVEDNDIRIAELLKRPAERSPGLIFSMGEGDFTDETSEALREVFTLMAENYVLLRVLRGWRALDLAAAPEGVETLRSTVLVTFRQSMVLSPTEN